MRSIYLALSFTVLTIFSMDSLATQVTAHFDSDYTIILPKPCVRDSADPNYEMGKCRKDNTLDHGGLQIEDNDGTTNTGVGDGIDETWRWSFDFRDDVNYSTFPPSVLSPKLSSALLTLELIFRDWLNYTDYFLLADLMPFGGCSTCDPKESALFDLGLNEPVTLKIDLLTGNYSYSCNPLDTTCLFSSLGSIYSSDEILGAFYSNESGVIAAEFGDDAIVKKATLSLSIPEPPTLLLFGTALIFIIGVTKKDQWGHI